MLGGDNKHSMDFVDVSSSLISAIAYDRVQAVLAVRFRTGKEYHYFSVPLEVYEGFLSCSSCGRYFEERVKRGGYRFHRVA